MRSFLEEGPVRLIARLVRSEAIVNDDLVVPKANRVAFEFDCIDAALSVDEALATINNRGDRSHLAMLKILTTAERFRHLADVGEVFDGQWYLVDLLPREKKSGPLAWASVLGDEGYDEVTPLVLGEIRYLFSDDESPISPAGATVEDLRYLAQKIAEASKFPNSAIGKSIAARKLLSGLSLPYRIIVRDVGQASFCSAIDQLGNELFHLDAGWPISFNKKTASKKPQLKVKDAPVILSHWDWDHMHGYHAIPGLSAGTWIVPVQKLGPGAALVANVLAARKQLLGVSSSNVPVPAVRLGRCRGKVGNLNQTGLCIQTTLQSGKTVLFVGDADYQLIPKKMVARPDYIVATHHGAKFAGSVVSPSGTDHQCVVSVGTGNGYGHPSERSLARHESAGWSLSFTCKRNGVARGNRYLGP